jgi:hypothetical protein
VLGDAQFGDTILLIYHWYRTLPDGGSQECVVFVGESPYSGLPSLLEEPCTLFMNYIHNGRLHILYPDLTLERRGLLNRVHHRFEGQYDEAWFKKPLSLDGYFIGSSLRDFSEHASHICFQDRSCPAHLRILDDGCGLAIPFFDFGLLPAYPYISWTLKSACSCLQDYRGVGLTRTRVPRITVEKTIFGLLLYSILSIDFACLYLLRQRMMDHLFIGRTCLPLRTTIQTWVTWMIWG